MFPLGVASIITGGVLIAFAVQGTPPVATFRAVLRDPERTGEILDEKRGTWGGVESGKIAVNSVGELKNGYLKKSQLAEIPWEPTLRLRPDALAALISMNTAFRARFKRNLNVVSAYRSYADQVAVKAVRGKFAAKPGTSKHGLGSAVDFGSSEGRWDTAQRNWLVKNAGQYGWVSPGWAQKGSNTPEPWHWEYGG